jgi:site-specific DNA-methyltransferase (adenine-specific)
VEQTFIDAMKIAGFNVKSEVIWDKVYHGMGDTKAAFAPSHENIVFAVKGKYSFPGSRPKRPRHIPEDQQLQDGAPHREACWSAG